MEEKHVVEMGREFLDQFGLEHWAFGVSNTKRAIATCHISKQKIVFSKVFMNMDYKEIKDTILHEIAHALDWERNRKAWHGHTWKAICREIGARPRASKAVANVKIDYKYDLTCEKCGNVVGRAHRKSSSSYRHVGCGGDVIFHKNY